MLPLVDKLMLPTVDWVLLYPSTIKIVPCTQASLILALSESLFSNDWGCVNLTVKVNQNTMFYQRFMNVFFYYMYMYGNVHIYTGAWRGHESVSDPLRLELQAVVRCLTWVEEAKLMASARAVCIVNY